MLSNEIDNHKLIYHPESVTQWMNNGDCFPVYVEIGLTDKCNHRCIYCALDWLTQDGLKIEKDIMLRTLEDMAGNGVKSVMFAGEGEPLLHGNISDFVKHAKDSGLAVAITTNGVLFDREKAEECLPYLSWIRFSVDTGDPEVYASVHRTKQADLERVVLNIKNTSEIKKKKGLNVDIGVQALLIPQTIDHITTLAEKAREAGADNLQVKPYSQHPHSKNSFCLDRDLADLEKELKSLETNDFRIFFRKNTIQRLLTGAAYDRCHGLPFFALITASGYVVPCNMFYERSDYYYGNLYKETFHDIWTGSRRKKVMQAMAEQNMNACRSACRLDPINRYLHRLKNPEPGDVFI